jgi:hypothetical protein
MNERKVVDAWAARQQRSPRDADADGAPALQVDAPSYQTV